MESYRLVHNKVNLLNKMLKRKYYSSKIQENVGNLRETWQIANKSFDKLSKTTKIDSLRLGDEKSNPKHYD